MAEKVGILRSLYRVVLTLALAYYVIRWTQLLLSIWF